MVEASVSHSQGAFEILDADGYIKATCIKADETADRKHQMGPLPEKVQSWIFLEAKGNLTLYCNHEHPPQHFFCFFSFYTMLTITVQLSQ